MSDEADSATENHETIEVFDTPQSDNPRFGSVTVRLGRGNFSQTIRMTQSDAENLAIKLYEYIDGLHDEDGAPQGTELVTDPHDAPSYPWNKP